jgi:hypothetical protein
MISELFFLACGMYVGKYYPEYVPIPRIKQEHIDLALAYVKSLQTPPAQTPEIKNE